MSRLTVAQIRAREAMEAHERAAERFVRSADGGAARHAQQYRSQLRALPALIKGCGLIHASAILAKDSEASRLLLESITRWLGHPDCPVVLNHQLAGCDLDGLQKALVEEPDMRALWRSEDEALAFAGWLKLRVESDPHWPAERSGGDEW